LGTLDYIITYSFLDWSFPFKSFGGKGPKGVQSFRKEKGMDPVLLKAKMGKMRINPQGDTNQN
jgi:hypothetical protein